MLMDIYFDYWKVLNWSFWRWERWGFFEPESWWRYDIYLVFLNFPRYYRTWKICFFMQCRDEFWQGMTGATSLKSVFYFNHPCPSASITFFHFPHFYFQYNFEVFQRNTPSRLFPGVMLWRGMNTENSVITGHKTLFWISVNLSDTFKIRSSPFVWLSPGQKKMKLNQLLFYVVYLIMVDMSFS